MPSARCSASRTTCGARQADRLLVPERAVRAAAVGGDAARHGRDRAAEPVPEGPTGDGDVRRRRRSTGSRSLGGVAVRSKTLIWIDHHVTNDGLGTIRVDRPRRLLDVRARLAPGRRSWGARSSIETAMCCTPGSSPTRGGSSTEAVDARDAAPRRRAPRVPVRSHPARAGAVRGHGPPPPCRLLGLALERVRLEDEADLVWSYLTQADLEDAGVPPSESDDVIDLVRTAREADVAAVLRQQRDGRFKVSLRSRGGHDVAIGRLGRSEAAATGSRRDTPRATAWSRPSSACGRCSSASRPFRSRVSASPRRKGSSSSTSRPG